MYRDIYQREGANVKVVEVLDETAIESYEFDISSIAGEVSFQWNNIKPGQFYTVANETAFNTMIASLSNDPTLSVTPGSYSVGTGPGGTDEFSFTLQVLVTNSHYVPDEDVYRTFTNGFQTFHPQSRKNTAPTGRKYIHNQYPFIIWSAFHSHSSNSSFYGLNIRYYYVPGFSFAPSGRITATSLLSQNLQRPSPSISEICLFDKSLRSEGTVFLTFESDTVKQRVTHVVLVEFTGDGI